MLDVIRRIVDALADLKAFDHNTTAELHAAIDRHDTAAPAPDGQDQAGQDHGAPGA